jgi:hypothetical protein
MNRQRQIDAFLQSAHRLALAKLRREPERALEVRALIARWRERRGPGRSDRYLDEWEQLLALPIDELERTVCADNDHAAALRSSSPFAPLLSAAERDALLRSSRQT